MNLLKGPFTKWFFFTIFNTMIEKIFNFFDKINVFNINTMWKSIFWIIWDITFAIFDFVNAEKWWVFGCGVAMCLFLIYHFKIFLHFKREQDEKIRQMTAEFMKWFPERYKENDTN